MSMRRILPAGLLAITASLPAHAAVDTRTSVDVAANAGWSNNPFAGIGGDTSSGFGEIDITPRVSLVQPRSVVTLSGQANIQQYFRRYSNTQNFRASADYRGTPTERLNTHARLDYSDAIIGGYGAFDTTRPFDPGTDVIDPVDDVALFGTRDRRRNLRAFADASAALSSRDSINVSGFADFARYRRFGGLGDYDGYGGSLGYDRQVSGAIRVGVQGTVSQYDYDSRGRTRIYAVEATVSARLNDFWSLNGRAGASFVDSGGLGSTRSTSPSGSVDLCRRGDRSSGCLSLSRQVRPTGFNGTQYVTVASANWSRRLGERDTLSATAAYSRENGAQSLLLPGLRTSYVRANVAYDRRLSERLRATASVLYRDISARGIDRAGDYGGRIGLAYRIGDPR